VPASVRPAAVASTTQLSPSRVVVNEAWTVSPGSSGAWKRQEDISSSRSPPPSAAAAAWTIASTRKLPGRMGAPG